MSIKSEMISGVFWSAIQKYSGLAVQLIVTAILARLLSPEDFGVIAIATVIIAFFVLFTDMGIGPAIVQNKNLDKKDLESIFSFGIYCGIILTAIFFFGSNIIASFYREEILLTICQILSVNLLFAAWNIVPNALMLKNKRFKFIAKCTLTLQVVCGVISVFAAYRGAGVYALLISPVVTSIGMFIINYFQYPIRFHFKVCAQSLSKIMSFSIYQFLFNFVNYFSRNLDKLIIGRYYSMNELGYYEKSYRLMMLPMNYITNVVSPVMHPILSSLQNDYEELSCKYNKIIKILLTISFPLGAFLYFSAEDIIMVVYGPQWSNAIPVFQILALSLPLQMILSTIGAIYQASGKTNWLFYGGVSNTVCTILGFILATILFRKIEAMAWAWDITLFVNTIVSYLILYKVVLKTSIRPFLAQFVCPFAASILIAVILGLIGAYIVIDNKIVECISYFVISAMITLAFNHVTGQYNVKELINFIWKKRKHKM